MDEKSLKKRIREIREELRLTQEEFAQELGIDSSTYWR
ncbi:MAG: helix-turn-helix transcriptional regulator, partial [Rikenellaceae bacterium]|nr:helix-turn-helix transcriptional regulator [Rikenellaceae bacterium]